MGTQVRVHSTNLFIILQSNTNPVNSWPAMAPAAFDSRKQAVLAGLCSDAADKSPKGHVDAPVRALAIRRHALRPRAPAA